MAETVELPVWLVVLAGTLAVVGLIDRLLTPAARWFFRRRINRAIDELNSRLQLKIRPFGLTKRDVLVDRLAHDPGVVQAAEEHARAEGMPVKVAMDMARRYAGEIVPSFNAYAYFRIGARLARWLSTSLYRVRLGYMDAGALAKVDPDAAVVFVMNHRSNMDYVLVTYLASASAALSYAVGEWARVPVLQTLIRSMGAYFIRRDARNQLYRRVLARYVQMATEAGVTQAVFPEGGLSRDGRLRPVRFGLLSYIVAGHRAEARDVVFVPVGINYDRVLEDRSLLAELSPERPHPGGVTKAARTLRFLAHNLRLRLAGRWHRFGYACVSFGKPVSLNAFIAEWQLNASGESGEAGLIGDLGSALMAEIGRVVPALPVPLVAHALMSADEEGLERLELKARTAALIGRLEAGGSHVHVPRTDLDYAVAAGLRMLELRRIVSEGGDGRLRIVSGEEAVAAYYAHSIAHLPGAELKS